MTLARLPDWRERLASFLVERLALGFDWRSRNCAFFAGDALEAQTGVDIFAPFRDKFSTPCGAVRALKREGFESVADYLRAATPLTWSPVHLAKLGDLVLVRSAPLDVTFIADGRGNVWGQDEQRVVFFAAPDSAIALRV